MSNYTVEYYPEFDNGCWNKALPLITKKSPRILDVGCSNGNFAEILGKVHGTIVDGVEPDSEDAKKARQHCEEVYESSIEDAISAIVRAKKSYDYITFMDVIEHLVDPVATLRSIKSVMAKNGAVIFSIPNMAHLSVRLMLLDGDFEYGKTGLLDNTHLHYYTKREIERVFAEAGYEIQVWASTDATYPRDMVEKLLKEKGLKASKSALDRLTKPDARVFQYVGLAVPSRHSSKIKRVEYSPDAQGVMEREFMEKYTALERMINDKDKELEGYKKEIERLSNPNSIAHRIGLRAYAKSFIKRKMRK